MWRYEDGIGFPCASLVRQRTRLRRFRTILALGWPLLMALGACSRHTTALSTRDAAIETQAGAEAGVLGSGGSPPADGSAGTGSGGSTTDGAAGKTGGGGGTGGSGGGTGGANGSGGFTGVGLRLLAGVRGGGGIVDGVGRSARLGDPRFVASDGAGNLYVADSYSNTIRKVTLATGAVTTVAGLPGVSGTADGTGSAARFNSPVGLAWDGKGTLYISDEYNRTIRKLVIATGEVTTLAGSPGVGPSVDGVGPAGHFTYPAGLALDGAGTLYVADSGAHSIRKVSLATTEVTTLSSFFRDPAGLAFDGAGALYVTDLLDVAIRKIDLSTNVVSTLAGSLGSAGSVDGIGGAARFSAPYGIVFDGAGNLLVSDYGNNVIRRVEISTATVTTMAGSAGLEGSADGTGSAARFNAPAGLSLDGGNLFISDFMDRTIRKLVLSTAEVTTLAGAPPVNGSADGSGAAARFYNPAGMTVNAAGDLFIADSGNDTIRRVAAGSDVVTTLAGSPGTSANWDGVGAEAMFSGPFDVTCDDSGNLFVADGGNNTIRAIVTATASVTTVAGAPGYGGRADGVGKLARFSAPAALAWGTGGILIVSDVNNNLIRLVTIAGAAVSTLAGGPPSPNDPAPGSSDGVGSAARFYNPLGVALDGAGNAYVADQANHTIRKVVIASGTVTTIAGSPGQRGATDGTGSAARFNFPEGLAYDGKSNLFVADRKNHSVRKIALATAAVTTYVGSPTAAVTEGPLPAGLNEPMGLAVGAAGELYITDENAVLVVK